MDMTNKIETKRLILRPFREDDLDIILQLYSNRNIMRYMPNDYMDLDAAKGHLQKIVQDWQAVPLISMEMAVLLKDTNEKIGRCRIHLEPESETAMVGWLLLEKEWNKGYATEITKALMRVSFSELHMHRVCAICNPENAASCKVMEKCGMRKEAHYVKKCKYTKDGVSFWEDEAEYAILASEFEERQHFNEVTGSN